VIVENKRELQAPAQSVIRTEFKSVSADGHFEGYASLFGAEDLGRDMVLPGAFKASLEKRGPRGVKMLYQHDPNDVIGVWTKIAEDAHGLHVEGQLLGDVTRAREVLALMRAGALDGLSIGYHVVKAQSDRKRGTRRLIELDLWEISVVTFPMLPDARISAVKQHRPTERQFERWLRNEAGFNHEEARVIIARGFKALKAPQGAMRGERALAASLRAAAQTIRP
jgi:hypothetical protein